jgi:putative tributyrin esterase
MTMRQLFLAITMLIVMSIAARARREEQTVRSVHTDLIWSQALGVKKALKVYLPPSYYNGSVTKRYPVAVYLHGSWGNENDWIMKARMAETMDSLVGAGMPEMIIVMPDGDDSWWTTWHGLNDMAACRKTQRLEPAETFCVPWPKYDDYVVYDVMSHVDSAYRTLPRRDARAVAGLSMGGYGALSIAARYPETFSVAASHSGVVRPALMFDSSAVATGGAVRLRDATNATELRRAWGPRWNLIAHAFGSDSVSWMSRDPARLLLQLQRRGGPIPQIYADVGTSEIVLSQNQTFRDAMVAANIPITYVESPGDHDWREWRAQLPFSLRFIAERLKRQ